MRSETVAEFAAAVRDESLKASVVIPRRLAQRMLEEMPKVAEIIAAPVAAPARAVRGRCKPTAAQQIRGLSRRASQPAAPAVVSDGDALSTEAWLAANPGGLQRLADGDVSDASRLRKIGAAARGVAT
jgi:hypothetical protein